MTPRLFTCCALLSLSTIISASSQTPDAASWPGPPAGTYAVGFRSIFVIDSARSFFAENAMAPAYTGRPIRIYVWYPAGSTAAVEPLRFGDYVEPAAPEGEFSTYSQLLVEHDLRAARGQFGSAADSLVGFLLESPTLAFRDAAPAAGRFPLILHSTGINGWQAEGSVLFEYLASHGYVVATVPQLGPRVEEPGVPYSPLGADLQRGDLAVALDRLINSPFVDATRVAAMGHSFGGLVALWLASTNRNIDAVVTLDGSTLMPRGIEVLDRIDWEPDAVQVPVFSMYTLGQGDRDRSLVKNLRYADRYFLSYPNASHFDFQNWPLHVTRWNPADTRSVGLRTHEAGRTMYLSTIQMTRLFFDAVLKGEPEAIRFVRGEERLPDMPAQAEFAYREAAGGASGIELNADDPELLLPGIVNTLADEYGPTYSPDGETLYFVRRIDRRGNEFVMESRRTSEGWTEPAVASFSGTHYDKEPFVSPDGNRLFFTSTRPGRGEDAFDIWMVERTGNGWGEPVRLGSEVNTAGVYDNYPTVAANGNLYYGSRREGGLGGIDLWVSRFAEGRYMPAENLGTAINTESTEADPYIAPDESFLIFCSTREGGLGSGDLYISYRNEAGEWLPPVNLGEQINTDEFEYTPLVSPDGEWFLFSRGWGEIYRIRTAEVNELNR